MARAGFGGYAGCSPGLDDVPFDRELLPRLVIRSCQTYHRRAVPNETAARHDSTAEMDRQPDERNTRRKTRSPHNRPGLVMIVGTRC